MVKFRNETSPHTLMCSLCRKRLSKILKIMLGGGGGWTALKQKDNIVITDLCSPGKHARLYIYRYGEVCAELCKLFKKSCVA